MNAAQALRAFPLLATLPDAVLQTLAVGARRVRVPAGGLIMREGSDGDGLYLLLEGELEVSRRSSGEDIVLGVYGPGIFFGELSLLEQLPRSATVRARTACELLVVAPEVFEQLLGRYPAVALALLRTVLQRLRSTHAAVAQHARLVSLGTLAAGIAHEVNNPAAALRSGLAQLGSLIDDAFATTLDLGTADGGLLRAAIALDAQTRPGPPAIGSREEAAAEDGLCAWLAERGIDGAPELAPRLLAGGWSVERLEAGLQDIVETDAEPVLRWLAARGAARALLHELPRSARAITDVVGAVRQHAAPGGRSAGRYDVAAGIEAALLVLRSRIGPSIRVDRAIAADLPPVSSSGELTQVWANLLENALDAVGGDGIVYVRAWAADGRVHVRVTDSGAGIAPDVQSHVFDPFYTTKPGGTGLGLHIARTIVQAHGGALTLRSGPDGTVVDVSIPTGPG